MLSDPEEMRHGVPSVEAQDASLGDPGQQSAPRISTGHSSTDVRPSGRGRASSSRTASSDGQT